jgi:uncharacterized protein YjiS (DUF1127 family)
MLGHGAPDNRRLVTSHRKGTGVMIPPYYAVPVDEGGRTVQRPQRRESWLALLWAQWSEWRERAKSRHDLRHLDARMRADIGLSPAEIERECEKPFWRG